MSSVDTAGYEPGAQAVPLEQYRASLEDVALIAENALEAWKRWTELWDIFEAENVKDHITRSLREDRFYAEQYLGFGGREDGALMHHLERLESAGLPGISPWLLLKYGTQEAKNDVLVRFAGEYEHEASMAFSFCKKAGMDQSSAHLCLEAAHSFVDRLYEIDFIETDELLKEPLQIWGTAIINSVMPEDFRSDLTSEWRAYLDKVIMYENLIGEDGCVMVDTILTLLAFTHDWFTDQLGIIKPQPNGSAGVLSGDCAPRVGYLTRHYATDEGAGSALDLAADFAHDETYAMHAAHHEMANNARQLLTRLAVDLRDYSEQLAEGEM